ncbi:MAG: hypothetical protein ACYDFT_08250 [Thermoplasmata archaeon]
MRVRAFLFDLELLREGIRIGWDYGRHPLVELARVAEYIERSVYRKGSLAATAGGLAFVLHNAPLRQGAFGRVQLFLDGVPVAPDRATIHPSDTPAPRPLSEVRFDAPVVLRPGVEVRVEIRSGPEYRVGTEVTVRMELENVAIPPKVWLEFRDRVLPEARG